MLARAWPYVSWQWTASEETGSLFFSSVSKACMAPTQPGKKEGGGGGGGELDETKRENKRERELLKLHEQF